MLNFETTQGEECEDLSLLNRKVSQLVGLQIGPNLSIDELIESLNEMGDFDKVEQIQVMISEFTN